MFPKSSTNHTESLKWGPSQKNREEGVSAGVAIAVRSHFETGLCAETADLSPGGSEGRLAAAWTRIGSGTGILILSAYLWHTEELSMRNKSIPLAAIARAKYFECTWVIGAGFQMPPQDLQKHLGTILGEANAYTVAPNEPTHRPEHVAHRTVDYFIACGTTKQYIADVVVDLAYEVSPPPSGTFDLEVTKTEIARREDQSVAVLPAAQADWLPSGTCHP